ncbi:MAG: hypothetical protein CMJ89_03470 [Planctomycetes bacterium]|nr:hypothetical protein [Planctomycetota bacterium]
MLVKDEIGRGFGLGLGLLVCGVLIGYFARPLRWLADASREDSSTSPVPREVVLSPHLVPNETDPPAADNGLRTLFFEIPEASTATLQRVRDRAIERGVIVQTDADTVPATLALDGGAPLEAEVRIKGDWVDHVQGDSWSLRVKLADERLLGMRVFSIQRPMTRGMLWEWTTHEAARKLDVLAPRSTFVNVVINGNPNGLYFLEEHFSKEMVEAQGRREGPIVLWDESTHWAVILHKARVPSKEVRLPTSRTLAPAHSLGSSPVRAYGEKRLNSIESLNSMLLSAVDKMRALRAQGVMGQNANGRMRAMQALSDLQGKTLEQLVDVERLARYHALASLFQIGHSLIWHNMRFYHDPLVDRLEPISFDNMPHEIASREPVPFRARSLVAQFAHSSGYYDRLYHWMGRISAPGWVDELFEGLEPQLSTFESALSDEQVLGERFALAGMKQRLRAQAIYLRKAVYPPDPANFEAFYELDDPHAANLSGTIEVDAWSTTLAPVVVEGFRFSNGAVISGREALIAESLGAHTSGEAVVLPYDGRSATFRFDLNERLANLETVKQLKQSVLQAAKNRGPLGLDIDVLYRPIAAVGVEEETLVFRPRNRNWGEQTGRPAAPSLDALLERHPFLIDDGARSEVTVFPGTWEVEGDLVLPLGLRLRLTAGTTLQFDQDAVLLAQGQLLFRGSPGALVVLEQKPGLKSWKGVCVLEADGRSQWESVVVRNTDAVSRAGWVLTGGVTFYRSPITMRRVRIENTFAEDGTNFFGTDFLLEEVTFKGCASDSFDGDFVTGEVRRCVFEDGLADGVDFSGSDVRIVDSRFLRIGDKAISAGEDSVVHVQGGMADEVSIGIAAKDGSRVTAQGMTIRGARNYALAAFIKKPQFGPCSLSARDLTIEGSLRGDALAQTGCALEIDGVAFPTQDLDVERLYREKILGQ